MSGLPELRVTRINPSPVREIRPYPIRYRSKDRLGLNTPGDGELNRSGVHMPRFFLEPNSLSAKKDREQRNLRYMPPAPRPHQLRSASGSAGSQTRILHSRHNDSAELDSSFNSMRATGNGCNTETFFRKYFEIQERLGFGSFGDVFRTKSNIDGKEYAVKKSRNTYSGEGDRSRQLREVQRVVHIPSHTHMVELERAWEEEGHLYIQMELCLKSLNQEIEEGHELSEEETWNVLIDMLLALQHLHKHHLVHMDLKPDNIFLTIDSPPIYKLGDFGIVVSLDENRDVTEYTDGDSRYLAPEVMQGALSTKIDVFGLGLTILEIACNVDLPKGGQLWHQLRSGGSLPEPCNKLLPESLVEVLQLMLTPDPARRPEVADLFKLPIVKRELSRRNWFMGISYLKRKLNSFKRMWNTIILFIASMLVFNGRKNEPSPLADFRVTPEPNRLPEPSMPDILLNDTSFSDDDEFRTSVASTPVFASTPISVSRTKSSARHRTGRFSRQDGEDKLLGSPTSRNLLKEFEAVSD